MPVMQSGYYYHETNNYIIFYEIVYDEKSIKIHKSFGLKTSSEKNLIARYSFVVLLLHISVPVFI